MRAHVISIGNSKGIRLSQSILKLCKIQDEVDLDVKGGLIVIRPVKKNPRTGWVEAFQHLAQDDKMQLISDAVDLDQGDWEW